MVHRDLGVARGDHGEVLVAASEAKRVELEGVLRRMVAEAGGVLG